MRFWPNPAQRWTGTFLTAPLAQWGKEFSGTNAETSLKHITNREAAKATLYLTLGLILAPAFGYSASDVEPDDSRRSLTVDDLSEVKDVWGPKISPDGLWVAYTVTEVDTQADMKRSDIWLTRWDGTETVRLTATPASEHSPSWSPDGKYLAFLAPGAKNDSVDQLWRIDLAGRNVEQLTALDYGVSEFDWAPDAKKIALISRVLPVGMLENSADRPIVIDRLLFKQDGYGYLPNARSRLHLLDLQDRSVVRLSSGPHDEIMPSFAPDGRLIAYVTKLGDDPDRHENWDILTVEPRAGSKPKRISMGDLMECDPVWGWTAVNNLSWSPDGQQIACIQSGPLEFSWFTLHQVALFSVHGDQGLRPTADLDRTTTRPRFSEDGKRVFFLLEDDQNVHLASISTDGRDLRRLTPAGRTVLEYDIGPAGQIALLSSSPDEPAEISVLDGETLRPLTQANQELLRSVQLMPATAISYTGPDGSELHGLLIKPPGFKEGVRYPTIMRLQGGPNAQWQNEFDFSWQVLAAQGYVVFGPNPRGSSGRGEAFQKTTFGDWGNAGVVDVLAAADYLVATGIADESRLGVGGWSNGAILTNYVIASDTRFRAATSGGGMSNMFAGFGTDSWWQDWELELGLPWETPENWLRLSYPFLHADRIETPTLFLSGMEDYNVPAIHAEQMYTALRRLGVPTQLVVYPGQSHSVSRPSFARDVLSRYLSWYGRWLQ